ncbi:MAG: hypothetical protein WC699_11495 [Bacteroidales bacterium]|jgi:hypothetical protein
MKNRKHDRTGRAVFFITILVFLSSCGARNGSELANHGTLTENSSNDGARPGGQADDDIVTPPPFSDDIFPCTYCHTDLKPDPNRRELKDMHEEISAMFNHDRENRWCLDCHDMNNRDFLKLASGKLLDFKESYKLCGQCHGDKLRDWKVGVHGKRTGNWNGKKTYMLCVNCHNPHSPKFKDLTPEPPPIRQEDIN